ncbi:MAG: hypothetical protein R3F39_03705 [Myxococcota bacterium]
MRRPIVVCLAALAGLASTAPLPASAATTPVTLPAAGLEVRLSAPKGHTWKVSSRWTPTAAHDLLALDPPKPADPTYMVEVGYFSKRCTDWVQSGSYSTATRGTFPTSSKLKQWHSVTGWLRYGKETRGLVCIATPKGLEVIVQVILPQTETMADPAGAVKTAVTKAAGDLEAIRKAFETPTTVDSRPLNNPQVSSDGSIGPRKIRLVKSGLDVTLPADGAYWRYDAGDTDALIRQVPRMPALTARIYGVQNQDCTTWLDAMASRLTNPAQRLFDYPGVPAGYEPGAVMWPFDRTTGTAHEVTVCYQIGSNLMGVAMISTPAVADATPFAPLLESLAAAAQAAVPAGSYKARPIPPSGRLAQTSPGGPLLLPAAGIEIDLPRVANQIWSVSGSAKKKDAEQNVFKDELARWVRGEFVGGARVQLGELTDGCPEWQAKLLSAATGGGRIELSGEAGGGLYATAAWGVIDSRPQVAVCAQNNGYDLNITVWDPPQAGAVMDEAKARGLLAANRPFIQAVVKAWPAGPDLNARPAHDARLQISGLERARTLTLPSSGYTLELPDDGLFWHLVRAEPKSGGPEPLDSLTMLLPSASMADVYIEHVASTTDCPGVLRKGMEARSGTVVSDLSNLPSGYDAAAGRVSSGADSHTLVLCHASAKHLVLVQLADRLPIQDLGRFVPILGAIAKASDKAPSTAAARPPVQQPAQVRPQPTQQPPRATPRQDPPPQPPPRSSRRGSTHFIGWWETEVALSHRNSDRDTSRWPDTRVTYLGVATGLLHAKISGFSWNWRVAGGGSFDWAGTFGPRRNTPEYGGQHWYLDADVGLGFGMGRHTSLTFGPGWHAMSGPITRNAGFTAGAMLLHLPAGDDEAFGWALRVTPVFLMTRNNMNVLAPLMAEFRVFIGSSITVGLELQYIDPDSDAKRTPAKAWATIFKFGIGGRSAR